jgi:hypothetical protein
MSITTLMRGLAGLLWLLAQSTWALSCYEGVGESAYAGSREQIESIKNEILLPNGITPPNTIIWRSENLSTHLSCFDTDNHPEGEPVYLYWDPAKNLSRIHPSIQVGISIDGVDYPLTHAQRYLLGAGTKPDPHNSQQHCQVLKKKRPFGCAASQQVTLNYSLFVKTTGAAPPASGRIHNAANYNIFQVDGEQRNTTPLKNFNLKLTGLQRIRFVACNPQLSIIGSSGNSVNFGVVTTTPNAAGQIIRRQKFSVKADLRAKDSGGVCDGRLLKARFSTTRTKDDRTILPPHRDDIGFQIFQKDRSQPIVLDQFMEFETLDQGIAEQQFEVGLLQITAKPRPGFFAATATIEISLK